MCSDVKFNSDFFLLVKQQGNRKPKHQQPLGTVIKQAYF